MRVRRLLSCFLFTLMALNTVGYYYFLVFLRNQAVVASTERIHSPMHELGATFIVKVPMANPYLRESESYEPVSGHFTYEGDVYQTTKRRFYRDTLYIVCVRDQRATDAQNRLASYAKSFAGDEQTGMNVELMASLGKYYLSTRLTLEPQTHGWEQEYAYSQYVVTTETGRSFIPFHPPPYRAS